MTGKRTVRIAAMADLHYDATSPRNLEPVFASIVERADVLLVCGDLTDHGLPEEASRLCKALAAVKLPTVCVLGNHDHEADRQEEIKQILTEGGLRVLDGDAVEIQGVGFAGVKGFAGGFGRRALGPWGELAIKRFVHEALGEALKLEAALAKLRTPRRIVLLHYSPIEETVQGEPPEIFCFLGSSRLEEPLGRFPVDAVFHGHAHHGRLEGRTKVGVPVYNVSKSLLERARPGEPPFRLLELTLDD